MRAGIYVRISQDREGAGLGVQRQEDDCRRLAERRGWDVVEVFADNDVSAYSGKARPAWNLLREAIEAGGVDAVVCWHVDRLTRSPRELEDVIDYAERRGVELATVTGDIDLATPTGRMVARMLGAAARHEAEHKAERQRRERRANAEAGRVSGGGHRPFGYEADGVTIREDEAEVIRWLAGAVLSGQNLSSLVRELTERGIQTVRGRTWHQTSLRRMLVTARISGRREHIPAGSAPRSLIGEITATAVWPAIISPEDSDRLRRLLTDPARRSPGHSTGRTYLASGILRCRCGKGMVGQRKSDGTPRYCCPVSQAGDSCGSIRTTAARTDEYLRDLVLVALDDLSFRRRLTRTEPVDQSLDDAVSRDSAALGDLAAEKDDGVIDQAEYLRRRSRLSARLEANRAKLLRQTHTTPLAGLVGGYAEMAQRWEQMTLGQKRAVLSAVFDHVIVDKGRSGQWDTSRFRPVWKV
jgi:DNA invertase Pin-like site-specific DNA recombinase